MGWFVFKSILFAISLFTPFVAIAQTSQMTPNQQLFRAEELDSLIAPIALYPDTLLAEMLMASTYPVEIVQAERWLKENKKLKDAELKAAVDKQAWDETVKSMVAAPLVLTMMSTRLDWTQRLGDAVLAQQPDVMDAIQRLRSKAKANKKLSSNKEQKVTVTQDQNKEIIVIEPTDPEIIYVPYYDPLVVYGGWYYPAYPPYYFPPPVHVSHPIMLAGIAFGAGYILGRWGSGGNYWGGGINWSNNNININRPRVNPLSGSSWQHRPEHRQGVRYNNASVQQRFGNNNFRSGSQQRMEFRGRGGEQKPQPVSGTQRPGAGQKSGAATSRPAVGDRAKSGLGAARQLSRGTNDLGRGDAFSSITNPSGLGGGNAFGNIQSGRTANLQSQRGHASVGSGGFRSGGGGGGISAGGGGGFRGGGGRGGGGRRSDIRLKHDVTLLGHLDNGLGFYRFVYNDGDKAYVGVMAQEVQIVEPEAVVTGRDGFLRVFYRKLGLKLQAYDEWMASGARLPSTTQIQH